MKLLPYFLTKQQKKDFTIYKFSVFLSHAGKSVWEEPELLSDKTIKKEYCESNGLYVKNLFLDTKKQIAYIEIDTSKTILSDFYSYEESIQKSEKPECWRNFYFIQDKNHTYWWSPKGLVEAEIQGIGNVQIVFEDCISRSKDILL
jgi:hypothetical protein